jgi:ribonuclease R
LEEVIYSDQRFAYEEAHIIETKDNTMPEEISISGSSYVVLMKLLMLL